jgi:thioredoxin 1
MLSQDILSLSQNDNFDDIVMKSTDPIIVDFYADWCGPCKKLGPELEKASQSEKCFKLIKVNVDYFADISEKYNVSGIPHVILFYNGKQEMTFTGYDINSMHKMVQKCKELGKFHKF